MSVPTALVAATFALSGCQVFADDPEPEPEVVDPQGFDPDVGLIFDSPEKFADEPVELEGEVAEVFGPTAFFLLAPGETVGEPLLVVHEGSVAVEEGDTVQVEGAIDASLDIAEVERDLGIELEDALLAASVGEGYVRAESLAPAP